MTPGCADPTFKSAYDRALEVERRMIWRWISGIRLSAVFIWCGLAVWFGLVRALPYWHAQVALSFIYLALATAEVVTLRAPALRGGTRSTCRMTC